MKSKMDEVSEYQENINDMILDLSEYLQEVFDKFNIPNTNWDPNFLDKFGWYIYNDKHITIANIPNTILCEEISNKLNQIKELITKRLNRNNKRWKIHIIVASESTIRIFPTIDPHVILYENFEME